MTEDKPSGESKILGGLMQAIGKASDIQFALIVITVFLALDIGLIKGAKSSVLTYAWGELDAAKYKELALIFLAYLCWMAVFSKGLRALAEAVVIPILGTCFGRSPDSSSYEYKLSFGRVPIGEAKKKALTEKDEFWIERVDAAESEADTQKKRMDSLAGLSFSTVCLAVFDLLLTPRSVAGELITQFEVGNYLLPMAAVCVILVVLLIWILQNLAEYERTETWIEHPELAKELLKRRQDKNTLPLRAFEP